MAKDKEPATVGGQMLDLVSRAKPEDLAAIDESISAKEKEIDSLRAVRKVLALALGVEADKRKGARKPASPPPSGPSQPKPDLGASSSLVRRQRIALHLLRNGPTSSSALARMFDIPGGSITMTLEHEWFAKGDSGYELTPQGREAAKQLALTHK